MHHCATWLRCTLDSYSCTFRTAIKCWHSGKTCAGSALATRGSTRARTELPSQSQDLTSAFASERPDHDIVLIAGELAMCEKPGVFRMLAHADNS